MNKKYLFDALRAQGLPFLRYYNYTKNTIQPFPIPSDPSNHCVYAKQMELPFFDADFFPLKQGHLGLLYEKGDNFLEVV